VISVVPGLGSREEGNQVVQCGLWTLTLSAAKEHGAIFKTGQRGIGRYVTEFGTGGFMVAGCYLQKNGIGDRKAALVKVSFWEEKTISCQGNSYLKIGK